MNILPYTPRFRTTWREKSHFNDILEEVFAQTYQGEQCGFGMDLVVILENGLNCKQMQSCYSVLRAVLWRMRFVCFCAVVDLHGVI